MKSKIIYKGEEYDLKEYFVDIDNNYNNKEEISFILRLNKNISDISYMFRECEALLSIREISNLKSSENNSLILSDIKIKSNSSSEGESMERIINQNYKSNLYNDNEDRIKESSISSITNKYISNISTKETSMNINNLSKSKNYYYFDNITNMNLMFFGCKSLISLPDLSKLNTLNLINMNSIFNGCASLKSFPDFSKWDISNVMSYI